MNVEIMENDLINRIDEKIKDYETKLDLYKPFERKMLDNISSLDYILKQQTISFFDLALASVIINEKYDDVEELYNFSNELKETVDMLSVEDLQIWIGELKKSDNIDLIEKVNNLFFDLDEYDLDKKEETIENILKLFKFLSYSEKEDLDVIFNLIDVIDHLNELTWTYNENLSIKQKMLLLSENTQDFFNKISLKKESLKKENKKINKQNTSEITKLSKLKREILNNINKNEITNIDIILSLCDDELKKDILLYIKSKNQLYYESLEKQYNDLRKNSISSFINIFGQNNVNFLSYSEKEQKEIILYGYDYIEKIFDFLNKIELSFDKNVISIIKRTNIDIINQYKKFLQEGYISSNFIRENISILFPLEYQKLLRNMKILIDKNINIKDLEIDGMYFYIADSNLVQDNIQILEKYKINIKARNIKNYNFLTKENLEDYILSLKDIDIDINNNLYILNCDYNIIKRIKVCKSIGVDIYENNRIKSDILDKKLFFIPDSKIDKYVSDKILILI